MTKKNIMELLRVPLLCAELTTLNGFAFIIGSQYTLESYALLVSIAVIMLYRLYDLRKK